MLTILAIVVLIGAFILIPAAIDRHTSAAFDREIEEAWRLEYDRYIEEARTEAHERLGM